MDVEENDEWQNDRFVSEGTASTIKGTFNIYVHPGLLEDLNRRRYHRSDDVYSLGSVI